MGRERHQGLLAQVLGIEIPLINGLRVSRGGSCAEALVNDFLNDRHRLGLQKTIERGLG